MAIFHKAVAIVLVWAALFAVSYFLSASREEEDLSRLHRLLVSSQNREAYELKEVVWVDGKQEVELHTRSQTNPRLTQVISRARLTETEDFRFAVYFHPEAVYLYSGNSGIWSKASYNHPAVAQLEGLRDPMALWLRLIAHAQTVNRTSEREYAVTLAPFRDDLHGILLDPVKDAKMRVTLTEDRATIAELTLDVQLIPSIIRNREHVRYLIRFEPANATDKLTLPEEAKTAQPMP